MFASNFGEVIWFIVISFLFISYLMIFFNVVIDIFRDREMSGGMKAIWLLALIFFQLITLLIYVVVRGPSMARRQAQEAAASKAAFDDYVRTTAGSGGGPASELAQAKSLLDAGAISQAEYDTLKAKVLG